MKENKIKAILVIVLLFILFVLSSFAVFYLDNLVIRAISGFYATVFLFIGLMYIIAFIGDAIIELLKWLENNLK